MRQRHLPDKSGVDVLPLIVDGTVNHPYPWPRASYNENLNPRITMSLANEHLHGIADALNRPGLYYRDDRAQMTIQNLMVPRAQATDKSYG